MKKLTVGLLTLLISALCYSSETQMDKEMLNLGLLNENYKYKDLEAVAAYFQEANNVTSLSLPIMIGSSVEVVSIVVRPFLVIYLYKVHQNLTPTEKVILSKINNEPSEINQLCSSSFNNMYQYANNQIVKYIYNDLNNNLITEIRLDASVCG